MLTLPELWPLLVIKVQRGEQDKDTDGDVDVKDPSPCEILCDDTSQSRPGSHTQRDHHRIQAQRHSSFIARKATGDHGNVDREDQRTAYSLEEAGKDEKQ